MAVTQVTKIRGDDAVEDANGRRLTERFLVYCDVADGPLVVFGAADPTTGLTIPSRGDVHAEDDTLKAQSITPSRWTTENNPCFLVTVQWDNAYRDSFDGQTDPKPPGTNVIWNKRVSSSGQETVEDSGNKNVAGLPVKNSVGDIYQQNFPIIRIDRVINVAFNTDDPSRFVEWEDASGRINSDTITLTITRFGVTYTRTFPPYTLKWGDFQWTVDVGTDGGFFDVTLPLIYRHQLDSDGNEIGWKSQIPDVGTRYYDSASGKLVDSPNGQLVHLTDTGELADDGTLQHMIIEQFIESIPFAPLLSGI